jgi:outer membrane lipoprotein
VIKREQETAMKRYLLMSILIFALPSCAHVISRENLENAVTNVPFREIQMHIEEYTNRMFIYGGIIAETVNMKDGAEIEVVQTPLDRWGNVISRDISDGRFIIAVKRNLDPLIFRTGREITMAGVLTGTQKVMMGGVDYTYPVFEAKEIQLRPEERYPVWRDPFYYPYPYYWYDPYWNRPFLSP